MDGSCVMSVCDEQFEALVVQAEKPVLVDFSTDWCPPCRASAPVIEQICAEKNGVLKVVKIDTDQCQETARRHRINSIPTFVLYRGGKVVAQTSGFGSKKVFMGWLEGALAKP